LVLIGQPFEIVGGRSRTRTYDPLIKSFEFKLFSWFRHCFKVGHDYRSPCFGALPAFEMISQRARYALRAIIALSRARHPMRIADIAESQRIPRKFLEHILLELKVDGIVLSHRGKLGSYELC